MKEDHLGRRRHAHDEALGWFEGVYAAAKGERDVPWAKGAPNRLLRTWPKLRTLGGDGLAALVVGCGLGDDAEELARAGFRVTAFDISRTAISWARRRFPGSAVNYRVADLYDPPAEWRSAFDFVFEAGTLQSLPADIRAQAIDCVAECLSPGGTLLVICFARLPGEEDADGPPWGLTRGELGRFTERGLEEVRFEEIMITGGKRRPGPRYRIEYRRPVQGEGD